MKYPYPGTLAHFERLDAKETTMNVSSKPYAWQQGFVAGRQGLPATPPAGLPAKSVAQWKAGYKVGAKTRP